MEKILRYAIRFGVIFLLILSFIESMLGYYAGSIQHLCGSISLLIIDSWVGDK